MFYLSLSLINRDIRQLFPILKQTLIANSQMIGSIINLIVIHGYQFNLSQTLMSDNALRPHLWTYISDTIFFRHFSQTLLLDNDLRQWSQTMTWDNDFRQWSHAKISDNDLRQSQTMISDNRRQWSQTMITDKDLRQWSQTMISDNCLRHLTHSPVRLFIHST